MLHTHHTHTYHTHTYHTHTYHTYLLAIAEVVVKSVLAIMDSFGISVVAIGIIGIGVTICCHPASFDEYETVPGKFGCYRNETRV